MKLEDFDTYQQEAAKTAIYPGRGEAGGLLYAVLGLTNEAGEVAGKVKKMLRDDDGVLTDERKEAILAECGDVLWYLSEIASNLDHPLSWVAWSNLDKLKSRQERGTLGGDGDTR